MKLILAPLQGVTDYHFRNSWSRFFGGIDEMVAPFIPAVSGSRVKPVHVRDVLPEHNAPDLHLIPQVLANESGGMMLLAREFVRLGYTEMNWNLGCPSAVVSRHGRGCGLMPKPMVVQSILREIMDDLPLKLSVKLRSGMYSTAELPEMLRVLNDFPLSCIIHHPRLGVQMYEGAPDPASFAVTLSMSKHPVVYNGDILTPKDLLELKHKFPEVDQWMLGRGVLKNPLLPELIRGRTSGSDSENINRIRQFYHHLEDSLLAQGITPHRLSSRLKEYWRYFSYWFADPPKIWYAISRTTSYESLKQDAGDILAHGRWAIDKE
ncbi:MAG TPA: tRNA-dihydrouridine synthase family protein [Bacteroidales bacterium]|nr:tRNA-dihydrouridine synthase family protein [Bacteroidales bacterium]HRZ47904.1 tRNA-dihydrouridine synthase family protein [Bacteroidales bacterium]